MDDNTPIKVELPLGAWNYILGALADRPYKETVNIINVMNQQAQPQLEAAKAKQADPLPEAAE